MKEKAIYILLLFFICVAGKAESFNFRFTHITKDNGLAQNHVTCIMQDHKGLMWLGTKNGLCKYNGYEMQTYQHRLGDKNSLSHNFIRTIFQDAEKRIWIGTDGGICRFQPDLDEFVTYEDFTVPVTSFAQMNDSVVYCSAELLYYYDEGKDDFLPVEIGLDKKRMEQTMVLAVDHEDTMWIGGTHGLIGYNADFTKSKEINVNETTPEISLKDKVISLFIDSDNNIWIGKNGNGIICYSPGDNKSYYYKSENDIPNGVIRTIDQDAQKRIWIGTEKGISVLKEDNTFENIQQDYTNRFGLNDNAIYSIKQDRDGNMWVGTYFGGVNVFYQDFEQFKYYSAGYTDQQLKGKAVRQMIKGNGHTIWISTEDGGLHNFDVETGKFHPLTDKNIQSDNIHSLQIDKEQNLWVGTFLGGLTKYNLKTGKSQVFNMENSSFTDNNIFTLLVDNENTLWIGTSSGLRYYNREKNRIDKVQNDLLSTSFIFSMMQDRNDNLWIGLRSHGIVCYNIKQGVVRRWEAQVNENALTDNFITSILEDSDGQIWVGTNNGGLYLYRPDTDNFKSFLATGLIPEQSVYGLIEDNEKKLWITTNNGLFCYNRQTTEVTKYTTEEGLPTNHFNYASTFKDDNGIIYMGTVQGMISFNPRMVQQKTKFPNIVLTGLTIGNKNVHPQSAGYPLKKELDNTSKIVLNHKQAQFVGIEYAGISLGHAQNIIYAVMMEGLNPEWQIVNAQRRIVFSHLPAGKYTFRVKASSSKNTWNDSNIRSLEIVVKPPFYFSTLALIIYLILFIVIAVFIFKFYYRRLEEKNSIRVNQLEKEKLEEMNELKRSFFTNISHEFKTPLTLIMAPVQRIIDESDVSDKIKKNLELVLKNSNSLMNLVKELIDFNKMESNQTQLKLQKGNPLIFIREICNRFQVLSFEDEVKFTVEIEDLEEEVWFGLTAVEKIITNLLSNAFKYTPKGGNVNLSASITEDEENNLFLKIEVTDTGIGIEKKNQEKIFNAYYQTNQEITSKRVGFGIGLSLTKSMAELHKGNIKVESELGKGSRFTVLLNVSPDAFPATNRIDLRADQNYYDKYNYSSIVSEEQLQLISKNGDNKEERKTEILIVEDNIEMLKFLVDIFSEKYDVRVAKNGLEAITQMEEKLPDLLISDIMMPEMDGNELCKKVKSNIMTSHIPVVLLTAKTGTESLIKAYELGADVYLEKPFNSSSLLLQVRNLLHTRDNNRKQFKESVASNIGLVAKNKYDEKLLNDIKQVIEDNISNEEFSVSDIIKAVGISRTMLHVKLKSMLDMSIGEYIRNIRIDKAKELLMQGETIADTAYDTGFSDPNYFSKCFKKQVGKTPSEFVKGFTSKGETE